MSPCLLKSLKAREQMSVSVHEEEDGECLLIATEKDRRWELSDRCGGRCSRQRDPPAKQSTWRPAGGLSALLPFASSPSPPVTTRRV